MLGHKISDFRLFTAVSLEDLVPEENFYRQVERSIDLSFVRDLANEFYPNIGCPSIDPVVFFKLQMIAKYNGERLHGIRKPHYQRITDERASPTDPDSAPMQLSGGGSAVLGYHDHYVVDGGKARIILSAMLTPASIMDNTPILDLVDWVLVVT